MRDQKEIHDRVAKEVITKIVKETNVDYAEAMVILETVVLGTITFFYQNDAIAIGASLDALYEGVVKRVHDHRIDE